jgi:hypothetical protein
MTHTEFLADRLMRSLELIRMTLADFSDAEMLARPAPGANHAAWQLGHLISAEARMLTGAPGNPTIDLPAGFMDKFTKQTSTSDDAGAYPKKAELLDAFTRMRSATAKWVTGLTREQLDQPGPERLRVLAPTYEHVAALIPEHTAMHVGQFQVIRRKLGKPVLF